MQIGIRKKILKLYIWYKLFVLRLFYFLFGFEFINCKLTFVDKRLIIDILKKYGADIGKHCEIESPIIINTKDGYDKLILKRNVYIGKNVTLDLKGGIEIHENVTVSFGATIISHIDVGKSSVKKKYSTQYKKTIISKNCYIGSGSIVLLGVQLGENCVVAAGSIVTKSFPVNSIVAGSPAKLIKRLKL
jgi:acetyltransferase-like isoleucine patch superfamily enzyme